VPRRCRSGPDQLSGWSVES